MVHLLKIKQCYLYHILEGRKQFEIRKNDRDFQVGDVIQFLPIEDSNYNIYDLVESVPYFRITYIHHGLGMQKNYVCISIEPQLKKYTVV